MKTQLIISIILVSYTMLVYLSLLFGSEKYEIIKKTDGYHYTVRPYFLGITPGFYYTSHTSFYTYEEVEKIIKILNK